MEETPTLALDHLRNAPILRGALLAGFACDAQHVFHLPL
jgi:hypothetical protein